jgi:hypothetical protein
MIRRGVLEWSHMKQLTIVGAVLLLLGIGGYFYFMNNSGDPEMVRDTPAPADTASPTTPPPATTGTASSKPAIKTQTAIGKSVEGRDILAYHYGTGTTELLFVGGIHGGYEWNTVLVAYEAMDHLKANTSVIPKNVRVTIIPVLNPDGLYKTVGTAGRFTAAQVPTPAEKTVPGRFNANSVDLNRNFDCDWQANAMWQDKKVDGGTAAFSEPESAAMKNYVEILKPKAVVVWYSAVGGVFSSSCHNGVLAETKALTNTFAKASGYRAYEEFNFYEITGDMVNWLAKLKIPAISILLTNHTDTEWTKNKAGIEAVLSYYAK